MTMNFLVMIWLSFFKMCLQGSHYVCDFCLMGQLDIFVQNSGIFEPKVFSKYVVSNVLKIKDLYLCLGGNVKSGIYCAEVLNIEVLRERITMSANILHLNYRSNIEISTPKLDSTNANFRSSYWKNLNSFCSTLMDYQYIF